VLLSSRVHGETLVDVLRERAANTPSRLAFEFVSDEGTTRSITYAELDMRARAVAATLTERNYAKQRALLLYSPGIDYIIGFFGCLYAGTVAVPVYLPTGQRGLTGMVAVIGDAGVTVALGDRSSLSAVRSRADSAMAIAALATLVTDEVPDSAAQLWDGPGPSREDLAFLQYTSGSTGSPKGVMVRHANLMHNSAVIRHVIGAEPDSRCVSWLPPYHDMGLIGGILQPVYAGYPCTLMAPMTFLRRPVRWLDAISRTRATVSVAPDFAYLECARRISPEQRAELDLSSWRRALTGAEPVRPSTMAAFADAFEPSGFRRSAFVPCYGLAEATLFVSGKAVPDADPAVIDVSRPELELGRAVLVAGSPGGSSLVLTGCGRPHSDDLVVVVDENDTACEPGVVGEIWVSGAGVTAGYWGKAAETERVFGATLPAYGDRTFLRTSDLGFQLDGELFVTGRRKDLMIVRARNHYPQDLEHTAERAHPDLRPSSAAAFSVDDGTTERVVLVHEVVRGFQPANAGAVMAAAREAVAAEHGLALHDVALVRTGSIPRTTSGKIQRGACRDRWLAGSLALVSPDRTAAPAGLPAQLRHPRLADIVSVVLGVGPDEVDMDISLVANGLDSLTAVRLAGAVRETFDVEVDVDRLLDGMKLAELDRLVAHLPAAGRPLPPKAAGPIVATRSQQWMWLLDQRLGASGACHVVGGVWLTGRLDPQLLQRSLNALMRQHEVLCSVFRPTADGSLQVKALDEVTVELLELDVSGSASRVRAAIDDLAAQPFDLEKGPLLRAVLIRVADDDWCLGVCAHHIVADGWSMGLLLSDLGRCYRALTAGAPVPDVTRPAVVPGDPLSQAGAAAAEEYWRAQLSGSQAVALPLDHPMPAVPKWRAGSLPFELTAAQTARLKAYGAAHDATPFMVLLAGLGAVLARWTGQDKPVIGTPVAGRQPATAEHIGMFINILPMALDTAGLPTFAQLLARARAACLSSYPHRDLPFERILRLARPERQSGRAPLVRVVLAVQNVPMRPWQAGTVHAEPFELPAPGVQFELYLRVAEQSDGRLAGDAVYMSEVFEPASVQALLDALRQLLDAAPGLPDVPVVDLPLLSPAEHERLLARTSAAEPPAAQRLHDPVQMSADRHPDALALVAGDRTSTYREVEADANRLAHLLRDYGVGPEDVVLVHMPPSVETVVAVLAVLKAGACVTMSAAAVRPKAVLRVRQAEPEAQRHEAAVVWLDTEPQAGYSAKRPVETAFARSLALVDDFGLLIDHAAAVRQVAALPALDAADVVLATPSVLELMWSLGAGATVVLDHDQAVSAGLIAEYGVTTWVCSAGSVRRLLDGPHASTGSLRRIVCREPFAPSLIERIQAALPSVELIEPAMAAPAYVLDARGHLVPDGAIGELHLGGPAVPRGYVGNPGQTAARFLPAPSTPGGRLYRTGDRGRRTVAGDVTVIRPVDPPDHDRVAEPGVDVAPRNPVERRLAAIWCGVLGVSEVSVTSDFFELGGHSLLATQIAVRIRIDFGVEVPVAGLLSTGLTIARLAEQVQAGQLAQADTGDLAELLDSLSRLSDEQAALMLAAED
jgi:acyl-CoA synthetase (AMP-forming)/AMP-acid ligase II/acyl carrier protein